MHINNNNNNNNNNNITAHGVQKRCRRAHVARVRRETMSCRIIRTLALTSTKTSTIKHYNNINV